MYNLTQATMTMDYNVIPAQPTGLRELSFNEIDSVNGGIWAWIFWADAAGNPPGGSWTGNARGAHHRAGYGYATAFKH
jgi:hypothetical protein